VTGVRPEEFSLSPSGRGLAARVVKTTFLGRYVNYELEFSGALLLPDQAAIEFSQDVGTAKKVFSPGETIHLEVNPEKINVFSESGASLMNGVKGLNEVMP
jgi:iron(III) transport system ATP-binding protein